MEGPIWGRDGRPPIGRSTHLLSISEGYSGRDVELPIVVWRSAQDGPTLLLTGAVHGDEINGTGAIRHLIRTEPFELTSGTLVAVPVVNLLGFERHSRYLPDRRDLNRSFPGSADGSLASRMARTFFDGVVRHADFGIDLHSAVVRRTNFPNVRADLSDPRLADFARAFGTELIVRNKGVKGSLRASANAVGCRTLLLESGEVWKVEPAMVEYAVRGILNGMRHLGMIDGVPIRPPFQLEVEKTHWVRAERGGFLRFHVAPGALVQRGDALATNTSLIGEELDVLTAPKAGVVLGMTTLPAVSPGDPICHLGITARKALEAIERRVRSLDEAHLHRVARDDFARRVQVTEADAEPENGTPAT